MKKNNIFEKVEISMELGSMQVVKNAVEAGLGTSILPRLTVQKELKFRTLREVPVRNFKLTRDFWMVQKPRRFKKDAQQYFEEFLMR